MHLAENQRTLARAAQSLPDPREMPRRRAGHPAMMRPDRIVPVRIAGIRGERAAMLCILGWIA